MFYKSLVLNIIEGTILGELFTENSVLFKDKEWSRRLTLGWILSEVYLGIKKASCH